VLIPLRTNGRKEDLVVTFLFVYFLLSLPGKNTYAMSVLRRIEMKLDGQDIVDNRFVLSLEFFSRFLSKILINSEPLLDFQKY
jgi:hypothetical protein